MKSRINLALALSGALVIVAACGGGGATAGPTQPAGPTQAASQPPASVPPASEPPASQPAGEATVNAHEVGDAGVILVDGATDMTLYYFEQDVKDSGKSNCNEGCIAVWPALTVEAGATPTAGDGGDASKLGTITRDDGDIQVTYDGKPLYFYAQDTKPGDLNGVYTNWETVEP